MLLLGPAVTLAVCMLVGSRVGEDGNILFMVLLVALMVFLYACYPLLLGWWLVRGLLARRRAS